MRFKKLLIAAVAALLLLSVFLPFIPRVGAQEPEVYRGANYVDTDLGDGSHSWQSAPQWVYDGSEYVPYVFSDEGSYYQVQSGLVGARIFKSGYAEFWDPLMTEVRLYEEMWEVQYWTGSKWSVCDVYSPTYAVSSDDRTVNVTASFITDWPNGGERAFDVKYIFREGQALKHEITFTSHASQPYEFRVLQKWAGIVAAKVKHDTGEDIITSVEVVNSSKFRFLKEDGSLSIFEDQWDMYYGYNETNGSYYVLENQNLKPVEIDVHAQGLKADFIFSNWTLAYEESLNIDPATTTFNSNNDAYIMYDFAGGLTFFGAFLRFDISSIVGATITSAELRIYITSIEVSNDNDLRYDRVTNQACDPEGDNMNVLHAYGLDSNINWTSISTGWENNTITAGFNVDHEAENTYHIIRLRDPDYMSSTAGAISSINTNPLTIGFWQDEGPSYEKRISFDDRSTANIPHLYVVYNLAPANDGCVLTNPTDTDDILAQYATYIATVNVSDPDGYEDISTINLTIQTGTPTERVTFLYTNSSDTFSEQAGATTAWELVTGSCVSTRAGNDIDLEFHFRAEWDATEESDLDFKVITVDSDGLSDTDTYDLNYDVITTLTVDNFASTPAEYVNPSTSTTFAGDAVYVTEPGGSTASAFYPADAEFTDVEVHDAGHSVKGTDSGIVNGAFSLSFTSDASVGQDTYHPFIDMSDADYTDADPTGITDTLTVDQVVFKTATTLEVGAAYADADNAESGLWYAELMYDSDDSELEDDGSVALNTGSLSWDSGDGRYEYTITSATVQTISRNIASVSGNARSITSLAAAVTSDSEDVDFDKVKCTGIAVSDARDDIGDTINIDFTLVYESDSAEMTDGTVTIEGDAAAHQGSGVWRLGDSEASVTQNTYNEFTATGNTRSIDTENQNGQSDTATWDRIEIVSVAFDDSRANIGANVEARYKLKYDFDDVEIDDGKATITGWTWDGGNSWWDKTVTAPATPVAENYDENDISGVFTDDAYALTVWEDDAGANLIGDRINFKTATFETTDAHINSDATGEWYAELLYEYDNAEVTDGTVTLNTGAMSWDSGGDHRWEYTNAPGSVSDVARNIASVTGNTHGITTLNSAVVADSETIEFDELVFKTGTLETLDAHINSDATGTWYCELMLDNNNLAITSGTITLNTGSMSYDGGDTRWEYTNAPGSVTDVARNIASVSGLTGGITKINAAVTGDSETIEFDEVVFQTGSFSVTDGRINYNANGEWYAKLMLDNNNEAITSGTITLNTGAMSYDGGDTRWEYTNSKGSVGTVARNIASVSGLTGGITKVSAAVAGDSETIIFDRIHATATSVSDLRDNVGDTVTVDWTLRYDYEEAQVTDGSVTIEGVGAAHIGSGVWRISPSEASVTSTTFNEFAASGNTHGITAVDANGQTDTVVWDRIEIVTVTFDDSRVNIGATAEVRFKLRYDWDDIAFDSGKGSISGYVWDAGNEWWDKTVTAPVTVGSELYDENDFAVTDSTYGLTAEENDAGASLIGDQVHAVSTAVVDTRLNINTAASITWALTYDFDEALMTDGSVTIEGVSAVHQGSGLWRITPTKTSAQDVTYNEFTSTGNVHGITSVNAEGETDTVIWDALKCTAFTRDVANQKLYVRMLYAYDSTAAENGTISFVGLTGTPNSTGWAEIALSGASNFDWGEEAYGTTDDEFDITATSENQTITLARYGQLIGGNAVVDDTSTWNGVSLVLDFSHGLGVYYTEIVTSTPSYVLNTAYDLGTDLSDGLLNLTHDGSQSSITMARQSWGGTFVQAVPSGYLTAATMAANVLTLTVSSATAVTDNMIVDCTGRGMPQTITGFDSTPLYEDPDLTGPYTTNVTLTLDWGFGAGGEPGETGGVGGTTTVITTVVPAIYLVAIQGETNEGIFEILWSSPITTITIRAITFLDHSDWFAINASAPFKLEDSIVNPEKMDSIRFTVSPDADARIGNYSIPVEFQLEEAAIANTVIYLSILKTPVIAFAPDTGPIPDIVGYLIGVGALVAIGVTLLRRGKFNGGRFRV